jgi:hypothetical protein
MMKTGKRDHLVWWRRLLSSFPLLLLLSVSLLLSSLLSSSLLSCSGEPPEILRVFWRLNLVENREQNLTYQTLSLFIKPNDPDGFEDIEEVFLINDQQELFWHLDTETWARSGEGEEIWIGSNSLKMPDGASFPPGEYRILLRDVGGDSSEQSIRLHLLPLKQAKRYLPTVKIGNGEIMVTGDASSYQLWTYDAGGQYVTSFPIVGNVIAVDAVVRSKAELRGGFSFKVYGFVENQNLGVTSGSYYIKP